MLRLTCTVKGDAPRLCIDGPSCPAFSAFPFPFPFSFSLFTFPALPDSFPLRSGHSGLRTDSFSRHGFSGLSLRTLSRIALVFSVVPLLFSPFPLLVTHVRRLLLARSRRFASLSLGSVSLSIISRLGHCSFVVCRLISAREVPRSATSSSFSAFLAAREPLGCLPSTLDHTH